jgi:hypothetical protein
MGTRMTVEFADTAESEPGSRIYRHWDGYPSGFVPDFAAFLLEVEANVEDKRFNDPIYLAAKYLVWQARQNAHKRNFKTGEMETLHYLEFLSVGPVLYPADDMGAEYVYRVVSDEQYAGLPKVMWRQAISDGESERWHEVKWKRADDGGLVFNLEGKEHKVPPAEKVAA